jgi:hypothetical protein
MAAGLEAKIHAHRLAVDLHPALRHQTGPMTSTGEKAPNHSGPP